MAKQDTNEVKTEMIGGVSQLQINKWKKQYGELTLVEVENEGDPLYFWFRKPDMKIMSVFAQHVRQNEIQGMQVLAAHCILNKENEAHLADPEIFLSVQDHMQELVKKRPSTSKKF